MTWLELIAIAFALAMDAFAVSIAAGIAVRRVTRRHIFRVGFHFGLFQFLMPLLGWLAGRTVADYILPWKHFVAGGLLALLGGKMLWDTLKPEADDDDASLKKGDPTRGWRLIASAVATSIDAFAVGLSMAFMSVAVFAPSLLIGVVAGGMSVAGILFGNKIGQRFGCSAERFGAAVLLALAGYMLLSPYL